MNNVEKVGQCVLHFTEEPLQDIEKLTGQSIKGIIDRERRVQLRNHHTATHIVFAACRQVLGPHIWQHGAKKTTDQAHLDITHFRSISR